MVTCVIQAGSSLGILIPPSVVLVLYAMIARQPVLQLWLAGVVPGLMMAVIFAAYISVRCRLQPELGPTLSAKERAAITSTEQLSLLSERSEGGRVGKEWVSTWRSRGAASP